MAEIILKIKRFNQDVKVVRPSMDKQDTKQGISWKDHVCNGMYEYTLNKDPCTAIAVILPNLQQFSLQSHDFKTRFKVLVF